MPGNPRARLSHGGPGANQTHADHGQPDVADEVDPGVVVANHNEQCPQVQEDQAVPEVVIDLGAHPGWREHVREEPAGIGKGAAS